MKKSKAVRRIIQVITLAIILALTVYMCIYVYNLSKSENMESFETLISSFGIRGVFIMLGLQILQVVLAVIPGEPIELIMGVLYGTIGGLAMCLAGVLAGSAIIFLCVKKFGHSFVEKFMSSEKFSHLKFLKNPAKRDSLMFILLFIPGTPKDTLTYFAPFTGINFSRFLIISTVARIPSIISSTYIGSSIMGGNYVKSIIVFSVVGAVSLGGILLYNKILDNKNKNSGEDNK